MIVVAKPVNWEVDGLTSEGGGAYMLSSFVQALLPSTECPLVHNAELDFGFIHRLDVPSSGLVLGGTSLEGLFHLKWQISVYAIERQYLTANHGHMHLSRMHVDERIDASTFESLRSTTDELGKPARTHLGLFAHLQRKKPSKVDDLHDVSLLAISIHTGRRHQIRAHTRHAGHPTVTDALYTPKDVMMEGRVAWHSQP